MDDRLVCRVEFHIVARNMHRKEIYILRETVQQVGFISMNEICYKMTHKYAMYRLVSGCACMHRNLGAQMRKLHDGEIHNLYLSPNIIRTSKSRKMEQEGNVLPMASINTKHTIQSKACK